MADEIEYLEFKEEPTDEDRETNPAFLRGGLTDPKPLAADSISEVRRVISVAFTEEAIRDFLAVLKACESTCRGKQSVGTVELYTNGLNVFKRDALEDGRKTVAGVWRWRSSKWGV